MVNHPGGKSSGGKSSANQMDYDCVHYKNLIVLSCGKKKLKVLTVQNVLSADAERTVECMNQALLANFYRLN